MSESPDSTPAGKREQVRESAKKVGEGFSEMRDVAKDAAKEVAGISKERATELAGELENYIREKPIQAVLIATGVGVVLGMLLRR